MWSKKPYYLSLLSSFTVHMVTVILLIGMPSGTSMEERGAITRDKSISIRFSSPPKQEPIIQPQKTAPKPKIDKQQLKTTQPTTTPLEKTKSNKTDIPQESTEQLVEDTQQEVLESTQEKPLTSQEQQTQAVQAAQEAQRQMGLRLAYEDRIRAHFEPYKRYPRAALRQHLTGEVVIEFRLNNLGVVQTTHIVQSSGHAIIDRAVLNSLKAASPYPPPPSDYKGSLKFTLPVDFGIR